MKKVGERKVEQILLIVFSLFLVLMGARAWRNMERVPLHDFDEANRAEGARNMFLLKEFLVPVTGSPFLRVEGLEMLGPGGKGQVWPHLERPPLVFWLMAVSRQILGEREISYRLPSFLFGVAGIVLVWVVGRKLGVSRWGALVAGTVLLTSYDWWLSAQMAHLDTGLAFLMSLSFFCFLFFVKSGESKFLRGAGLAWGLSFLVKGQMAALLLLPFGFLFLVGKLKLRDGGQVLLWTALPVLPWLVFFFQRFGIEHFFTVYFRDFLFSRGLVADLSQQAPFYWYGRWWLCSLRPGIFLFGILVFRDLLRRRFDWMRLTILVYLAGGFLFLSVMANKVWWYVLPFIPVLAVYVGLALTDFLKERKENVWGLAGVLFLGSLPVWWMSGDKEVFLWSGIVLVAGFSLMKIKFKGKGLGVGILVLSLVLSFWLFWKRFPQVNPSFPEVRELWQEYWDIQEEKCLWVSGMPYEAVLFYSGAGEVNYWEGVLKKGCRNFLVSPAELNYDKLEEKGSLKLYEIRQGLEKQE